MAIRDTTVKMLRSTDAGAPVLLGQPDSLINLLDAVLLNGYGSFVPNSIQVTAGIAVLSISTGHGLVNPGAGYNIDVGVVIQLSGATGAHVGLNREWRATVTDANVLTWECGAIADGTAFGLISIKKSPLGWLNPFSSSTKRVYKSADIGSTQALLRVENGSKNALIRGYSSMTTIDAGADPFPDLPYYAGYINAVHNNACPWTLIGDGKTLYLWVNYNSNSWGIPLAFGDFYSLKSGVDPARCFISGGASDGYGSVGLWHPTSNASAGYIMRSYTNAPGAVALSFYLLGLVQTAFPDPCSQSFMLFNLAIREGSATNFIRGIFRGRLSGPQDGTIPNGTIYNYGKDQKGIVYLSRTYGAGQYTVCHDIIGPWQ